MNQRQFYAYYDRIFAAKNYAHEAETIVRLLRKQLCFDCREILDIGCGTGRHAIEFARLGLNVHGIDIDPDAIDAARQSLVKAKPPVEQVRFECLSVEKLNGPVFDAAVCLFNVLNYILDFEEMKRFLEAIRRCLRPGGVLIFDCWNGVAAIESPPRIKHSTTSCPEGDLLVSLEPTTDLMRQHVRMRMTLNAQWEGGARFTQEYDHRLWTPWELSNLLSRAGFGDLALMQWMQPARVATERDWKIMAHCKAV